LKLLIRINYSPYGSLRSRRRQPVKGRRERLPSGPLPGRLVAGGLLPDALAGWVVVVEGLGKPLTAVEPQQQQRAHHCLGQGEGRASV